MNKLLELPLKIKANTLEEAISLAIKEIVEYTNGDPQKWKIRFLSVHFNTGNLNEKEYWFDRGNYA